jgi:phosphotriesterase-related protein
VVDAMPVAQGGDAARLAEISRRSGVHVIASTGLHTTRYDLAAPPDDRSDLAAGFVADLTRPDFPCGVVKVSVGPEGIDERARLLFAAAADASARIGAPILTHCEGGMGALEQVELLAGHGVDPGRVALSHTDRVDDLGYHAELLASGVNVVYDQGLRQPETTVRLVTAMVDAGHAAGIMLGTDGARRTLWSALGGRPGLAWMLSGLAPELRGAGVTDTDLATILVSNPSRWLEWDEPGGSAT